MVRLWVSTTTVNSAASAAAATLCSSATSVSSRPGSWLRGEGL